MVRSPYLPELAVVTMPLFSIVVCMRGGHTRYPLRDSDDPSKSALTETHWVRLLADPSKNVSSVTVITRHPNKTYTRTTEVMYHREEKTDG